MTDPIYAEPEPTNLTTVVIGIVIFWVICAGIGALVGKNKGRGTAGFVLGLLFGLIGVLITALLSPSEEIQEKRTLELLNASRAAGATPATLTLIDDATRSAIHKAAIAEALRRDPALAAGDDQSAAKLASLIAEIEQAELLKAEVAIVKAEQDREAVAAADAERRSAEQAAREAELAARTREYEAQQAARGAAREARLAEMGTFRRFVSRRPELGMLIALVAVAGVAVTLVVVLTGDDAPTTAALIDDQSEPTTNASEEVNVETLTLSATDLSLPVSVSKGEDEYVTPNPSAGVVDGATRTWTSADGEWQVTQFVMVMSDEAAATKTMSLMSEEAAQVVRENDAVIGSLQMPPNLGDARIARMVSASGIDVLCTVVFRREAIVETLIVRTPPDAISGNLCERIAKSADARVVESLSP